MRLVLLASLVMIAFAMNSILTRMGVAHAGLSPEGFAALRTLSGALALAWLCLVSGRKLAFTGRARLTGALTLALYMAGFSLAYLSLDAGVGALILFGGVQITMFAAVLREKTHVPPLRWVGAALALAGLAWLLLPGSDAPDLTGALFMLAAALGWGLYSLAGRGAEDPLAATASNFILCAPLIVPLALWAGWGIVSIDGVLIALACGVLTSALGYALWYTVLPRIEASQAAVAQLTVPVLAMLLGMLLLEEALSLRFVLAGGLVLFGVALSLRR